MIHKKIIVTLLSLLGVLGMNAQMVDPVHFTSKLKTENGVEAEIIFHATIDNGWHVYSTEIGNGGPTEATFNVVKMDGAELVGKLMPKGKVRWFARQLSSAAEEDPESAEKSRIKRFRKLRDALREREKFGRYL